MEGYLFPAGGYRDKRAKNAPVDDFCVMNASMRSVTDD